MRTKGLLLYVCMVVVSDQNMLVVNVHILYALVSLGSVWE